MTKTILLLLTLLACQNVEFASPHSEDEPNGQPERTTADVKRTSPGKINRLLMIRNFRALNLTMSSLTGVSLEKEESSTTFGQVSHMLASDNNIESFSATMQFAIFRLATSYCQKYTVPNVNDLSSAEARKDVAERLITEFWHNDLTMRANKDNAVKELVALANNFYEEQRYDPDVERGQRGQRAFVGMCTAALASASVTFH